MYDATVRTRRLCDQANQLSKAHNRMKRATKQESHHPQSSKHPPGSQTQGPSQPHAGKSVGPFSYLKSLLRPSIPQKRVPHHQQDPAPSTSISTMQEHATAEQHQHGMVPAYTAQVTINSSGAQQTASTKSLKRTGQSQEPGPIKHRSLEPAEQLQGKFKPREIKEGSWPDIQPSDQAHMDLHAASAEPGPGLGGRVGTVGQQSMENASRQARAQAVQHEIERPEQERDASRSIKTIDTPRYTIQELVQPGISILVKEEMEEAAEGTGPTQSESGDAHVHQTKRQKTDRPAPELPPMPRPLLKAPHSPQDARPLTRHLLQKLDQLEAHAPGTKQPDSRKPIFIADQPSTQPLPKPPSSPLDARPYVTRHLLHSLQETHAGIHTNQTGQGAISTSCSADQLAPRHTNNQQGSSELKGGISAVLLDQHMAAYPSPTSPKPLLRAPGSPLDARPYVTRHLIQSLEGKQQSNNAAARQVSQEPSSRPSRDNTQRLTDAQHQMAAPQQLPSLKQHNNHKQGKAGQAVHKLATQSPSPKRSRGLQPSEASIQQPSQSREQAAGVPQADARAYVTRRLLSSLGGGQQQRQSKEMQASKDKQISSQGTRARSGSQPPGKHWAAGRDLDIMGPDLRGRRIRLWLSDDVSAEPDLQGLVANYNADQGTHMVRYADGGFGYIDLSHFPKWEAEVSSSETEEEGPDIQRFPGKRTGRPGLQASRPMQHRPSGQRGGVPSGRVKPLSIDRMQRRTQDIIAESAGVQRRPTSRTSPVLYNQELLDALPEGDQPSAKARRRVKQLEHVISNEAGHIRKPPVVPNRRVSNPLQPMAGRHKRITSVRPTHADASLIKQDASMLAAETGNVDMAEAVQVDGVLSSPDGSDNLPLAVLVRNRPQQASTSKAQLQSAQPAEPHPVQQTLMALTHIAVPDGTTPLVSPVARVSHQPGLTPSAHPSASPAADTAIGALLLPAHAFAAATADAATAPSSEAVTTTAPSDHAPAPPAALATATAPTVAAASMPAGLAAKARQVMQSSVRPPTLDDAWRVIAEHRATLAAVLGHVQSAEVNGAQRINHLDMQLKELQQQLAKAEQERDAAAIACKEALRCFDTLHAMVLPEQGAEPEGHAG